MRLDLPRLEFDADRRRFRSTDGRWHVGRVLRNISDLGRRRVHAVDAVRQRAHLVCGAIDAPAMEVAGLGQRSRGHHTGGR
jgi:hypothetical protein